MWERQSRFNTQPGDIKVPAPVFYPSKPVPLQSRWLVRMVVEFEGMAWPVEQRVWATWSSEAVERAEAAFYAGLEPAARNKLPLRVVAVLQEAV